MKMKIKNGLLLFLLFLSQAGNLLFAQSKEELEKKKEQLVKEIDDLQSELDKTKKNKTANLNQLTSLSQKIGTRQKLINNYNGEIVQINTQITRKSSEVKSLDHDLGDLKRHYADMVVYAYKHRGAYDRLLFLFSANSFNDAILRMKYMKRYNAYRHMQAGLIQTTRTDLQQKLDELKSQRAGKKNLLAEQLDQKKKLSAEKSEKDKVVKSLTKQEKTIKANMDKKKKEQEKLKNQIADLIKKEIEAEKKKTAGTASSGTTAAGGLSLTPESKALSESFAVNMGKLPWPVEKGYIIETFGTHPHPDLKNVTTKNNGVDIKTSQGASVRAVFKGTVVNILSNPGYHKAVLVKHGEYYTVYSNLASVNVKAGQQLETKQVIGTAFTDNTSGITSVHLEFWKGTVLMDPENWIAGE